MLVPCCPSFSPISTHPAASASCLPPSSPPPPVAHPCFCPSSLCPHCSPGHGASVCSGTVVAAAAKGPEQTHCSMPQAAEETEPAEGRVNCAERQGKACRMGSEGSDTMRPRQGRHGGERGGRAASSGKKQGRGQGSCPKVFPAS